MGNKENNVILLKSIDFAVRIINLYKYLCKEFSEYTLSKQILRSGTSIGANVREAIEGITKADFKNKIYIALKEARETDYWLELLYKTDYLTESQYEDINKDNEELIKILTSIAKTCNSQFI